MGKFKVECNCCGMIYENWVGSTPCCGSIAFIIENIKPNYKPKTVKIRTIMKK